MSSDASFSVLTALREEMEAAGVHAFVVPSGEAHLSEYVHPCYERRAFVSGFTGSAGTAVITRDAALLWTDGRYFLQAEGELSDEWTLMRMGQAGVPTLEAWAAAELPDGATVGIDPFVHSVSEAERLRAALDGASRGLQLSAVAQPNLLDRVWARPGAPARAPPPPAEARELPLAVAGQPAAETLDGAREAARAAGADGLVVCMLDEVCWLLNVRGSDVPCCPVVEGYVVVAATDGGEAALGGDRAVFFADEGKVRAARNSSARNDGGAIRRAILRRNSFARNSLTRPSRSSKGAGGAPRVARGGGRGGAAVWRGGGRRRRVCQGRRRA